MVVIISKRAQYVHACAVVGGGGGACEGRLGAVPRIAAALGDFLSERRPHLRKRRRKTTALVSSAHAATKENDVEPQNTCSKV